MGLLDELERSKLSVSPRNARKMDRWLEENPDTEKDIGEAITWFAENRGSDFGWERLAKVLREKWPDFPRGYQHLAVWARATYPDLAL